MTRTGVDDQMLAETACHRGGAGGWLSRGAAALLFGLVLSLMAASSPAWGAEKSAPTPSQPAVKPSQEAQSPMRVEGFRSAHWGMTKKQVEDAIHRDFGIAPDKVRVQTNAAQRTTILSVRVDNLLHGAGEALVSYILGYQTKKLIEVNVLWGTPVDPHVKLADLAVAADQLRLLFLTSGYQPSTIVSNVSPHPGETIVFKGRDAEKHMTILRLMASRKSPPSHEHQKGKSAPKTVVLLLSYIKSTTNPDIYRLKKGRF